MAQETADGDDEAGKQKYGLKGKCIAKDKNSYVVVFWSCWGSRGCKTLKCGIQTMPFTQFLLQDIPWTEDCFFSHTFFWVSQVASLNLKCTLVNDSHLIDGKRWGWTIKGLSRSPWNGSCKAVSCVTSSCDQQESLGSWKSDPHDSSCLAFATCHWTWPCVCCITILVTWQAFPGLQIQYSRIVQQMWILAFDFVHVLWQSVPIFNSDLFGTHIVQAVMSQIDRGRVTTTKNWVLA